MHTRSIRIGAFFLVICVCAAVTGVAAPLRAQEDFAAAPTPLPLPPDTWTLTGSQSLYMRLYRSAQFDTPIEEVLPLDADDDGRIADEERYHEQHGHTISDRIVTAIAADLVVQFYIQGNPDDTLYTTGADLIVKRSDDLLSVDPAELDLGEDTHGNPFRFEEVKLFVRNALYNDIGAACERWPWWLAATPRQRKRADADWSTDEDGRVAQLPLQCVRLLNDVRRAAIHERELQMLREELGLIAYGQEAIWDGQLATHASSIHYPALGEYRRTGEWGDEPFVVPGNDLRTYDLALDIAAVGNVLGSAQFQLLFNNGSYGEQCDGPHCPHCILFGAELCGDGGVQGMEQCDDGNRVAGDGCDEFCQVEGSYCGDGEQQDWEACEEDVEQPTGECPQGTLCKSHLDCPIDEEVCDTYPDCDDELQRTCRYWGTACTEDADCACPSEVQKLGPVHCAQWQRNACRFAFDGVCMIGDIVQEQTCVAEQQCADISKCEQKNNGKFCSNHPYLNCQVDTDCYSCTAEEVWGTCHSTGEQCTGDEDCPSRYCILEFESICRQRSVTGLGRNLSVCNEHCTAIPYCGDRLTYIDETNAPEQCDDGMHCEDGSHCARGQRCADGSECRVRGRSDFAHHDFPTRAECGEDCRLQVCGDGVVDSPEECDTGGKCVDGTACTPTGDECLNKGTCGLTLPGRDQVISFMRIAGEVVPCELSESSEQGDCPDAENREVRCVPNSACNPKSDDGDACSSRCTIEYCGDDKLQSSLDEVCDDGAQCENGSACIDADDCPTGYRYCDGYPDIRCDSVLDCPGVACLEENTSDECETHSDDGCTDDCSEHEFCGDGIVQSGLQEECDLGKVCVAKTGLGGPRVQGADCTDDPNACEENEECVVKCSSTCSACRETNAVCGNGIIECNEECDDGNTTNGDGCDTSCKRDEGRPGCGNGVVEEHLGEECEPEYECNEDRPSFQSCIITNGCRPDNCKKSVLGNCQLEPGERCDAGQGSDPFFTGCDNGVSLFCGDGKVNKCGEQCDEPFPELICCKENDDGECLFRAIPAGSYCDGCRQKESEGCPPDPPKRCTTPCGSDDCGIAEGQCVGCCEQNECGDGIKAGDEECDDNNTSSGDGCSGGCTREFCGDGITQRGLCEQCDAGREGSATCTTGCTLIKCSNCTVDPGEQCDDGNTDNEDGCSNACTTEYCGDQILQEDLGEVCDDGGSCYDDTSCTLRDNDACPAGVSFCNPSGGPCETDADCAITPRCIIPEGEDVGRCEFGGPHFGCREDSQCQIEYACVAQPTECTADNCDTCTDNCVPVECGNGIRECGEQCDDGNDNDLDGCGNDCRTRYCGDGIVDFDGVDNAPGRVFHDDDANGIADDEEELFFRNTDDEQCDRGLENSDLPSPTDTPVCRTNCRLARCGDGVVDAHEQCDQPTCEDGTTCSPYSRCTDGSWCVNRDGDGQCNAECLREGCGDGIIQPSYGEQCDDGGLCGGDPEGEVCTLASAFDDCEEGVPCVPLSGDGCTSSCQIEMIACGNGMLDRLGGDEKYGIANFDDDNNGTKDTQDEYLAPGSDDEQCDPADPTEFACPYGISCDVDGGRTCDLGSCDLETRTCSTGNRVCYSDADCSTPCVSTCTDACRHRVRLCGDGYRDPDEECDDGNTLDGDGCSYYCEIEFPEKCGNGIVDYDIGEECDQGHPFHTVECTPFCRFPHPAPMCGDGRRDPSGAARGDLLADILTFQEGYQLDWRFPDGLQTLPHGTGGWYVTPRLLSERDEETPFQQSARPQPDILIPTACPTCGNGILEEGEQCDAGVVTSFAYNEAGVNTIEWSRRMQAKAQRGVFSSYYWSHLQGLRGYQDVVGRWNLGAFDSEAFTLHLQSQYSGTIYWRIVRDAIAATRLQEGKRTTQVHCRECSRFLCGNGLIEDGETCDDGNRHDGDGCNQYCIRETLYSGTGICGDDVVDNGEECDVGMQCINGSGAAVGYCRIDPLDPEATVCGEDAVCTRVDSSECTKDCKRPPITWDGVVDPLSCGNGLLEPYEECDDGGWCEDELTRHCTADHECVYYDANLDEEVDAGSCIPQSGDGCSTACALENPVCGDGVLQGWVGEECDIGSACDGGENDGVLCTGRPFVCGDPSLCKASNDDRCNECIRQGDAVCGNGGVEGLEQCDVGLCTSDTLQYGKPCNSDTIPNACRTNCLYPYCGDGVVDRGEECDDAIDSFCENCIVLLCGNGRLDVGEQCDDGNRLNGDGCDEWCITDSEASCGNGRLDPNDRSVEADSNTDAEQCDDGNTLDGDGCSQSCEREYCGDGIVQPGLSEECDTGSANSVEEDACRPDCALPFCGDDIIDSVEACDPGMHCKHDPSIACVNGVDCPLGACVIAPNTSYGYCGGDPSHTCRSDNDCLVGECTVQDEIDEDGVVLCTSDCTLPTRCGENGLEVGEECDDGNTLNGDGCSASCRLEHLGACGNGRVDPGEMCDDGNRANNDGCTETCQTEVMNCTGDCEDHPFRCAGNSAISDIRCTPENAAEDCPVTQRCVLRPECIVECMFGSCGNNDVDAGEQCDDGRHCSHDPSLQCIFHEDCRPGPCQGADRDEGMVGFCTHEPLRACFDDFDCISQCIPTSGDGCSDSCRFERGMHRTNSGIIICQEELTVQFPANVTDRPTPWTVEQSIGTAQQRTWSDSLLEPHRNPFFYGDVRFSASRGVAWWQYTFPWWNYSAHNFSTFAGGMPWYWTSAWWPSHFIVGWLDFLHQNADFDGGRLHTERWFEGCVSREFPSSIGNHIQSIAGCLAGLATYDLLPTQAPVMPMQPVDFTSYPACQEPRAQLVSAVEMPSTPTIPVPTYNPAQLIEDVERYLCSQSGYPRLPFLFLCASSDRMVAEVAGWAPRDADHWYRTARLRELTLFHTLDIGYRSGERALSAYLQQAVGALRESINTAYVLIESLQRIRFTETVCPTDGSSLCPPSE